MAPFNKCLR